MQITDDVLTELSREVSALARIRHGFIIQFYGLSVLKDFGPRKSTAIAMVTER